ncbi:ergothioneine biosynthesis glutamate--cysteine ligase EgtA [Streptomyces sp. NPDC004111]|uniref:ergothioneine biosynthesis glutamate--cysteine ligase EgtA n=1 Tax=Streptomyces sp. NPDC004111 TaxID=3364690 RepID=UPI0036C9B2AC
MPEDMFGEGGPPISETEAEDLLRCICFKTGPPRTLGVELEWLVHDAHQPHLPVSPDRLAAAHATARALPLRSAVTVEPGGQLELSSLPAASLTDCLRTVSADLDALREALRPQELELAGYGQDPWHPPRRFLREPRYEAMEGHLGRSGPSGMAMMCTSASIQVCLDAGHEEPGPLGLGRRWALAHLLGAVLVAVFAHSPLARGAATGWRSHRQALWAGIEAARSQAPATGVEPRAAWTRLALDATVLCVKDPDGALRPAPEGLTFREWFTDAARVGRPPTRADLEYHLTTLFPPVRPQGHLELRMIDAQPGPDGWLVPVAVTAALFDDPAAAESAWRAVKPLAELAGSQPAPRNPLWESAARTGLADPDLHAAAVACFAVAREALPRLGADRAVRDAVAAFTERYVVPGRSPADDLLDAHPAAVRTPPPPAPGFAPRPGEDPPA